MKVGDLIDVLNNIADERGDDTEIGFIFGDGIFFDCSIGNPPEDKSHLPSVILINDETGEDMREALELNISAEDMEKALMAGIENENKEPLH